MYDMRWDLTEDRRYTLSNESLRMIRDIEEPIVITVLLDGDIPSSFRGYRDFIDYYLSSIRRRQENIEVVYHDPNSGDIRDVKEFKSFLRSKGIYGMSRAVSTVGAVSKSELFPFISIHDGKEIQFLDLLETKRSGESEESAILRSKLSFEAKFLRLLRNFNQDKLPEVHILGFSSRLIAEGLNREAGMSGYRFISSDPNLLLSRADSLRAIIVVVNEDIDRRALMAVDQLGLNGVPVIWFVDKFRVALDSLGVDGAYLAGHETTNVEDYFFRLGVKINPSLIEDMQSSKIPQVVGSQGGQPQTIMVPYPYHIKALPYQLSQGFALSNSPVLLKFAAPIDTLGGMSGMRKEVLMATSPYTRLRRSPVPLAFNKLRVLPQKEAFQDGVQILGLEVSGETASYFKRRIQGDDRVWFENLEWSELEVGEIDQVLISDAQVIIPPQGRDGRYSAIGYNIWDRQMYDGNTKLISHLLEHLIYGDDILMLSKRSISIGILDRVKWSSQKLLYRAYIIALPIVVSILGFVIFHLYRKKYYRDEVV